MPMVWVPYPYFMYDYRIPAYVQVGRPAFPEVDSSLFRQSAKAAKQMMNGAEKVMERVEASKEFADELMEAAQRSNRPKVEQMIKEAGAVGDFDFDYNPERIKIQWKGTAGGVDCCKMTVMLRWRVQRG
ncbi:hypothetical protein QRD89_08810 [Halobacillus sp. ACCC02827]|uniref:hypothetical protein n=1 Tax=Bacillaceae TaxID=186817 RepID=UPI00030C1A8D|nr:MULTISPECIES: hypothetical protein [Bacillaceae]QHT46619.1 hypothetical protein M662_08985 [Bacillus sp. SB49]WJE17431.1 hypothetical protein QRD89_08810 [Halobacillus sp. ACCC02827]